MAIEKNTTGSNTAGTVTHKMLVTTTEGVFAISLFSNNELHSDFAKAFCNKDASGLIQSLITDIKIVPNEAPPKDDSRLNRLSALVA